MSHYRITTLVENCVYNKGLQAEHGLSLLIESETACILFDTGASGLFIRNADRMGIDLRKVDILVLSHGHRDHTGGVNEFLALNERAKVYGKPAIFHKKYKNAQENGMPLVPEKYLHRFYRIEQTTEIVPGVYLFPQLEVTDRHDMHYDDFYTVTKEGHEPDTFEDELAIGLVNEKGVSVLSACSHRGITNIIRTVRTAVPDLPLRLVLGGFHIHKAGEEKFHVISGFFGKHLPRRLGVCHCTGIDKYALFRQQFNDRVFYNYTGHVEIIE